SGPERKEVLLEQEVDQAAVQQAKRGRLPEPALLAFGVRPVAARNDPVVAALEDRKPADHRGDLRNELQRACAVADDGDAFAGKIVPVVPSRRVKRLSAER